MGPSTPQQLHYALWSLNISLFTEPWSSGHYCWRHAARSKLYQPQRLADFIRPLAQRNRDTVS